MCGCGGGGGDGSGGDGLNGRVWQLGVVCLSFVVVVVVSRKIERKKNVGIPQGMPTLSIFVGVTNMVRCEVLRGEVVMGSKILFWSIPVTAFLYAFWRNANFGLHSTGMQLPILACIRAKTDTHRNDRIPIGISGGQ